nr:MAG TPA: YvrJ protein family protein [Caudoviricetes sp.]
MTVDTVIQLINGVGFPIAACIAMGAYVMYTKKAEIKRTEDADEKTEKTLGEVKAAIENNTTVIKMLVDFLLKGEKEDDT